jgi:large subunit ribosomal protein L21
MFAIVEISGFQEMLKEGDTLDVPLQDAEKGKKIMLGNVLMIGKGEGDVTLGAPYINGASVELKVVEHGRGDKVRVYRMRRRKRFQKARGHRQDYTTVEVVKISL